MRVLHRRNWASSAAQCLLSNSLRQIVEIRFAAESFREFNRAAAAGRLPWRSRRSGADVAKMKTQIRAARKRKVPVTQIAKELGVTTSYIYQLER